MIDLHCHILPYVDDGPSSFVESIEMAKLAKENGIDIIVATPHYIEGYNYKKAEYNMGVLDKLNDLLEKEGLKIRILLGNEVYITPEVSRLLKKKEVITINNTRYLLIELPMVDLPMYVENVIFNLKLKGIVPIIAHPERNKAIIRDPGLLYKYIHMGALCQLNLFSLNGYYGKNVKNAAETLLKHNMIHLIGTDFHSPTKKFSEIKNTIKLLEQLVGNDKANKLLNVNPSLVIDNKDLYIDEPVEYVKRRSFSLILRKMIIR